MIRLQQHRTRFGIAVALCLVASAFIAAPVLAEDRDTEILWDTWGIPHIYGESLEDVAYGFGWAQMHNHGDLILREYGQSRGRAAEYWGLDYAAGDKWVWTVGIPQRAKAWTAAQRPAYKSYLDAFVEGMNDYAREHADTIADDVEVVLPVTVDDVMAHMQRVIHFNFVTSVRAAGMAQRALGELGSNTWAIAPPRTATGNAYLLANPHLPWATFFTWFEAHLVGPGLDAYGATLVGWPFHGIAFNPHLGWSHTVNTHDGADAYLLTLEDGGYAWDGEVRALETETHTLKIKEEDGSYTDYPVIVEKSVHGPVIARRGDHAVALRVAGLGRPHLTEQYLGMMRATNLQEFEAAQRMLQMPMFTVMYADRDGHIMHIFGGTTPVRPSGDYDWAGIVPGDTSETLWTEIHPYEDLPRILDPASNWLQNANDPPWTTTFPRAIDPDDYPPYMAPRFMGFRPQSSATMLMNDRSISFRELERYKHSTKMLLAERILDDLEAAVDEHGGDDARAAMEILDDWDLRADADSEGAVLFRAFYDALQRAGGEPFAVAWDPERPVSTPDGLADPEAAAEALAAAYASVRERHGDAAVEWGEVNRISVGGHAVPGNGADGELGVFRVVGYYPTPDGTRVGAGGDSYVCITEFGDPVRARALLTYGNATQAHTSHVGDQLELFSQQKLRKVWLTRKEIEKNLEKRETF